MLKYLLWKEYRLNVYWQFNQQSSITCEHTENIVNILFSLIAVSELMKKSTNVKRFSGFCDLTTNNDRNKAWAYGNRNFSSISTEIYALIGIYWFRFRVHFMRMPINVHNEVFHLLPCGAGGIGACDFSVIKMIFAQ